MFFDLRCQLIIKFVLTNIEKKSSFQNSRNGKRRQVSKDECLYDLGRALPKMFKAFNKGVKLFNKTMEDIPVDSRIRVEAPLLNSRVAQCMQEEFPDKWKFGKYKRFVLHVSDYLILVKKLNNHDKPMNIKTKHVNSISNQMQLSLFNDDSFFTSPIVFFGYKKDKSGEIVSPQLVYIDEDKVKWIITENDVTTIGDNPISINPSKSIDVTIKEHLRSKKASNQ